MSLEQCAFCDPEEWRWRVIKEGELFISFVSNPRFREGQCLVVPRRHVERPVGLTAEEAGSIMLEAARLSDLLDQRYGGYGSGMLQKYQPKQAENGIKVNHVHYHVIPRFENEPNLFPVPEPNTFDGFVRVDRQEIIELAESLR